MTAKIGLEDVRIFAPHGFFEEEHLMGNEFSIDVEVEATITSAAQNDDLGGTVNYATIYYLLQAEMKKPTQLLEALAYRMGNRIMNQFDSVSSVRLRLRKLNPPLGGKVGAAVVEVSLGSTASGGGGYGGYGGASSSRQDTFEDPAPRFDDGGAFGGGGGDFGGGGFSGGGFSGGGLSGLPKKTPPPPAFDESAFAGEYDDDDFDDDGFDDEGFDDEGFDDGGGDYVIPDADEDFDEDFGDEEFDEDFDGLDFDDLNLGDLGDIDMGDFNFDDLKDN
ncbi:MAG: dihydroneopterin aldolase [Lewinella sp.]